MKSSLRGMVYPFFAFTTILTLFSFEQLAAQQVSNIKATPKNETIIIEYDLSGEAEAYTIKLFSSYNNFKEPIKLATGDVGQQVKPGMKKSITWHAKKELGNYKGKLSFEVHAITPAPIPFTFTSPVKGKKVKRTKALDIQWAGGSKKETVELKLLKNNVVVENLTTTSNTGKFSWTVPKKYNKGEYQVQLKSYNTTVKSEIFLIKPKTSTLIKILPVAIIGVIILTTSGGDSETGSSNLPKPVNPN